MYSNEKKINKYFFYWLVLSLFLVYLIIFIGGLTRLTNSGLSITEWELIKGILPPLNSNSWENYFEEYKNIPQYKLLNFDMTLNEFKIIFYWEYFHRFLARIIGIFFLIPLIYFYFSKKIKIEYLKICFLAFSLIIIQGIVGWYMVKSGLIDDVTVSHYRLSIHLSIAILIISIIFWLIKNVVNKKNISFFKFSFRNFFFQFFILIIFLQVIIGAFVSGLDAGKIYQTWPLMNGTFFPTDNFINNLFNFGDPSFVQFLHRNIAYIIFVLSIYTGFFIYRKKIKELYNSYLIFILFIGIQVLLGILVLFSNVDIYFASLHQISSIFLIVSSLNLYFRSIRSN